MTRCLLSEVEIYGSMKSCRSTINLLLCGLSHVVAARTPNLEDNLPTTGPSLASFQHAMAARQPMHKSRSGLEDMESEGKQGFLFKIIF